MSTALQESQLIGAHLSIEGGHYKALERAGQINANAVQLFTKSNRQWAAKSLTTQAIEVFKEIRNSINIYPIAHASYLINLASDNPDIILKSIESVSWEIQTCQALEIPTLVLHPGSAGSQSREQALDNVVRNLDYIFDKIPGLTCIALETMAGQGSVLARSFEEIGYIINQSKYPERLGVCLDTCHVFAAGYNFTTPAGYQAMWNQFMSYIPISYLKVIHANDSKKPAGSQTDRHEHIGKGCIGIEAFSLLCNDPKLQRIVKIVETPKATLEEDAYNVGILKSLIKK
jgi:deoxyribonuclease-4